MNSEINNSCICLQLRTSIDKKTYIEKCKHLLKAVYIHPTFVIRKSLLTIRSHRNLNPYYSIHYHISMIFIILLFSLFTISSIVRNHSLLIDISSYYQFHDNQQRVNNGMISNRIILTFRRVSKTEPIPLSFYLNNGINW